MNKRMLVVAAALAVSTCMASAAQAQNLLKNASFEVADPIVWILADRGGTGALSTEFAHTGDYSAKIVGGTPNSMKQEAIELDSSKVYKQSVWVYLTSLADSTKGTEIYFRAGWKTDPSANPVYDAGQSVFVTETNKWVKVIDPRSFTGNEVCSMWSVRAFSGNVPVYFDDAELSAVPEPASIAGLLTGGLGMLGFAIKRRRF